jgi:hypothetical protein
MNNHELAIPHPDVNFRRFINSPHSLLLIGIHKYVTGSFRSNIGRDPLQSLDILSADLVILDEGSVLTPWVPNRAPMIHQSISIHGRI